MPFQLPLLFFHFSSNARGRWWTKILCNRSAVLRQGVVTVFAINAVPRSGRHPMTRESRCVSSVVS